MIGHNSPMRPELVYVPTVFIHSTIPDETIDTGAFHYVDLLPTILDVLDLDANIRKMFNGMGIRSQKGCRLTHGRQSMTLRFRPANTRSFRDRFGMRGRGVRMVGMRSRGQLCTNGWRSRWQNSLPRRRKRRCGKTYRVYYRYMPIQIGSLVCRHFRRQTPTASFVS